jgi:hypothetical protein
MVHQCNYGVSTADRRFDNMGDPKPAEEEQPVQAENGAKPKTCLDCGFLTIQGGQALPADRLLLQALIGRRAGNHNEPSPADLTLLYNNADLQDYSPRCVRGQWIDYDLSPYANRSKEISDELTKPRQECSYTHIPGLSPEGHLNRWIEETISNARQPPISPSKSKRQSRKRGRPKGADTTKRREVLRRIMQDPRDLGIPQRRRNLFGALEHDRVPIPGDEYHSKEWIKLLDDPTQKRALEKVLHILRMDFERQS